LGFVEEYQLLRYAGTLAAAEPIATVETAQKSQWERLCELDLEVTGVDRRKLLMRRFAEQPASVRVVQSKGEVGGFLTARLRLDGVLIGPCIAKDDAGILLFRDACHHYAGQSVSIDVPSASIRATQTAQAIGLTLQRRLLRRYRGQQVEELQERIWASSGPEKG